MHEQPEWSEVDGPTVNGVPFRAILAELARPVALRELSFRQQGKIYERSGKFSARFVPYVEAWLIRERLDRVALGRWSLETRDLGVGADMEGAAVRVLEAVLRIRLDDGSEITRSGVGEGSSAKGAASDAIKRAGVRFGLGECLYQYPKVWVQMESAEKYAKPAEDIAAAFQRALMKEGIILPPDIDQPDRADNAAYQALERERAELRELMTDPVWTKAERAAVERWIMEPRHAVLAVVQRKLESARATYADRTLGTGASAGTSAAAPAAPAARQQAATTVVGPRTPRATAARG